MLRSAIRLASIVLIATCFGFGCGSETPADPPAASAPPPQAVVADWDPPAPGWVVWESNRSGRWRLWIRNLDGSGLRQLTPEEGPRAHCCAHVRPDGREIAYLSLEPAVKDGYPEGPERGVLRLVRPDGSENRVLAEPARTYGEHRAAIWLDDRRLVYLDDDGYTVELDVENGRGRRLTRTGHPRHGWLVNADKTHATTGAPSFSLYDARKLAVTELQMLGGCQPYFSPDGRWGYWTAGAGGPIDKIDLESRAVSEVLAKYDPRIPGDQGYLYFPMLSPDGRLLAWAASAGEHPHFTADYDVYVAETDPRRFEIVGRPVRLTDDPASDIYPAVFLASLPLGTWQGEAPLTVRLSPPAPRGEWLWDTGDGTTETAKGTFEHTFTRPGAYDLRAEQNGRIYEGRVRVLAPRPPQLADARVFEDRRVRLSFDEPVDVSAATTRLDSGTAVASQRAEGKTVEIALAAPLAGPDVLRIDGLRDLDQVPNSASVEVALAPDLWPSDRRGLIFLWENAAAPNLVRDGDVERSFPVEREGRALLDHYYRMDLDAGAFAASEEAGEALAQQIRDANALTLEITLTPRRRQTGTVVAFSTGRDRRRNLILAQEDDELVLTLMTAGGGPVENVVRLARLAIGEPSHLVVSYRPGSLKAFLDGEALLPGADVQGDFFPWKAAPLRFGGERHAEATWSGWIEGVALYARTLDADEARENARRYAAAVAGRAAVPQVRVEARLLGRSRTPSLDEISPYRQALAVYDYAVQQVLAGTLDARRVRVAHWVLLDAERTETSQLRENETVELVLEPFQANPQLAGAYLSDNVSGGSNQEGLFYAVER